ARVRPRDRLGVPRARVAAGPQRGRQPVGAGRQGRRPDAAPARARRTGRWRVSAAPSRTEPGALGAALRGRRDAGGKCLVPYLSAGLGEWTATLGAAAQAGADAIEVGIPFSDPVVDGPVIQQANDRALAAGATPAGILDELSRADVGGPLAALTHVHLVSRSA